MIKTIQRNPRDVFENFILRIRNEVYSEPDTELYSKLIDRLLPQFTAFLSEKTSRILDVGCGQGYASLKFKALGYRNLTAITLSDDDVAASLNRGIECHKMDMSFLGFDDQSFDALWVRHALEHSPFPYLTLLEFNRVLARNGVAYIEMPGNDTPRELENWPNHYSGMGTKMWIALMMRSGFDVLLSQKIQFSLKNCQINHGLPFQQENSLFVLRKVSSESV
jgi:SAM-dependent methyltransferase